MPLPPPRFPSPGPLDNIVRHGKPSETESETEQPRNVADAPAVTDVMSVMARALVLHQKGQLTQAAHLYQAVLGKHPDATRMLGALLLQQGHAKQAANLLTEALKQRSHAGAMRNLIIAYKRLDQPSDALAVCQRALLDQPDDLWLNQNAAHFASVLKRWTLCAQYFEQCVRLAPDNANWPSNLGAVLHKIGRISEAAQWLVASLRLQPDLINAWLNLAVVRLEQHDAQQARECYQQVLRLNSQQDRAHAGLGNVAIATRDYRSAIHHFELAVQCNQSLTEAWYGLGMAAIGLREYETARKAFVRCHALDPTYQQVIGHALHAKMLCADWQDVAALQAEMIQSLRHGRLCVDPFVLMTVCEDEGLLRQGTEQFIALHHPAREAIKRPVRKAPRDRIPVGYVSGEFRQHATSILMVELWEQHSLHADLIAFDNGHDDGSPMRQRLQAAFDEIVPIQHLNDEAAARAVADRDIDILINLNGFFGHSRTGLFSHRPAPVQVNYLGFPGTIGAPYIDYIFADATVIPPQSEPYFTEQVIHVGSCYQPRDQRARPTVQVARGETGLPEGAFVYCCFNKTYKLTPSMWAVWMRVLSRVPGSVLWLLAETPETVDRLGQAARAHGVDPARLVFAERWSHERHLARHALADLFLDTLPCNAHTTAADALLAGLPVLTCEGTTFAGRVASSLMRHHGMPHWVAPDLQTYELLAVAAAGPARAQLQSDRLTLQQYRHEDYSAYFEALKRVHAMGPRQY